MSDYAHCTSCDVVINLDTDKWEVVDDETYCKQCEIKEYS